MPRSTFRPLGPRSLALAAAALAVAVSPAGAAHHANTPPAGKHPGEQRLVVRGDATAVDGPCDGAGTPDRLVLAVAGDSCQDGAGPLTAASFTGLAQFTVTHASGSYAGASGTGLASFSEDAANHHRMTLIGRVWSAS